MRHRIKRVHLNRDHGHRKALQKNLVKSLVMHGVIRTTKPKALFLRPKFERLVKLARIGDVNARRRLLAEMPDKKVVSKFINDAKVFKGGNGGYTRIVNLGKRLGDKASMVRIEWVKRKKGNNSAKPETAKAEVGKKKVNK